MEFNNLDTLKAYQELSNSAKCSVKSLLSKERIEKCNIAAGGTLTYNYAAMPVSDEQVELLQALADEDQLVEKYKAILSGEVMNPGEKRLVLHQLTRGQLGNDVIADDVNKRDF